VYALRSAVALALPRRLRRAVRAVLTGPPA
jgi:hypothetical protein